MNIDCLIDRDFVSVSVLEEMTQIAEWLEDSPYLAIVDEEIQIIGILLPDDAACHPRHLVIDFDSGNHVLFHKKVLTRYVVMRSVKLAICLCLIPKVLLANVPRFIFALSTTVV
jgi:hypothetical protein